jgi:hypothetical protein
MDKAQKVPMMARGLNSKKKASEKDEVREELLERTYDAQENTGTAVDAGGDMEKVQGHDIHTDLGYHRVTPDQIPVSQDIPVKTIMDESLGDVFDKTLSFTANSMDSYMRKVYEAETLLDTDRKNPSFQDSMMKYLVGFGLFIRDEGNAVYLGLVCILVSIIIYSLDITTS